jgi:uncharacterized protein (UPF0335 family)
MTAKKAPAAKPGPGCNSKSRAKGNGEMLSSFVSRLQRLDEEIASLNADKSDVYKEAKNQGFDAGVLREVVCRLRMDPADREERDSMRTLYEELLVGVGQ